MNILIVSPNASIISGGESIIPVHYFRFLLERKYNVFLIANHRNKEELSTLDDSIFRRISFTPNTWLHRALWRLFSVMPDPIRDLVGGGIVFLLEDFLRNRVIKRIVSDHAIDIIHQPVPVSPLIPSSLHKFRLPYVIGPLNGGMDYPDEYRDYESSISRSSVRIGRKAAMALNFLIRGKKNATTILVANERTRRALPWPDHPNVGFLVENGVDQDIWSKYALDRAEPQANQLKLVYMGRFVRLKGIDVTIQAVALANRAGHRVTLDLLGDGDERSELETLVERLGLQQLVTFHGFRPQADCARIMAGCDALILNSLRECGGAVVLEAMAMGMPVVASNWGGPADYVTPDTGILVDPEPRSDFAARLAQVMGDLARDPDRVRAMGAAALEHAKQHYDWGTKISQMLEIYRTTMARHAAETASLPSVQPRSH